MIRMLLVILLTFAEFAIEALGQKEFYTNGISGQTCGRAGRHCISTATCNKREGICHCKPPLTGNGNLGCFRPGDAFAILQMDPILLTFDREHLSIPTPCRYKVVHYTMATANGTRASAEIYAKNILTKTGLYYVHNVLVVISVMTESKVGKYSLLLEGSATGGEFNFVSTVLEDSMTKSSWISQHMDFTKFTISVFVDKVNNMIVATVPGVGLRVKFRPPSFPLEGEQNMVPGVTMVINENVVNSLKFVNGTISSTPFGPSIISQAKSRGLDVQHYVHLLTIHNTPAIIMDNRMCQDTTVIFKNVCKSDFARIELLKTCSSLYSDSKFLRCIYHKHQMEQSDFDHRLFFRYCAQAFCLQRADICHAMMRRIDVTKCPLPSTLRDFNCSIEAPRKPRNIS